MQKYVKPSKESPNTVPYLSAVTCTVMLAITVYLMVMSHVAVWAIFLVITGCTVVMPIQIAALGYLKKFNMPQPEDSSPSSR